MSLYDRLKTFVKNHSTQSIDFLSMNTIKKSSDVLSIQSKHYLQASELTADQETINKIVKGMIKKDRTHRYYIGKKDISIKEGNKEIYKYESLCTHNVTLIPTSEGNFDLYIEGVLLGQIPEKFNLDVKHYLQTTILMAFAYIKGGPYKYYDAASQRVREEDEPFDLSIYIQFS
ncbi:hypothetical protein SAMN04488102_11131 [Alkalibacterium subtropicum]|uniref:Uncharacterized protein n=1 Tax=Alkalibacterium subtropicum TaxID=753702 RepID=A0A1I1KJR3_9LACT|nr:hypothetical protein [Alkalibacterium subtropicum]SFC57680.1 hypothetical protein SAMN04488102_11131 [Alkalibacterium subtropicum]